MSKLTMREAISQALWEEMERDPQVFIMGEEVGLWGGTYAVTKGFYDHFGAERVRDTPIAEAAIIGGAIGALVGRWLPASKRERRVLLVAGIAVHQLIDTKTDSADTFSFQCIGQQRGGDLPFGEE